jgi:hypothetical protein
MCCGRKKSPLKANSLSDLVFILAVNGIYWVANAPNQTRQRILFAVVPF